MVRDSGFRAAVRKYILRNSSKLQILSTTINWVIAKRKYSFVSYDNSIFRVKNISTGFELFFPFKEITKSVWFQLTLLKSRDEYLGHYRSKYLYDGFIIPSNWDVIDCGAYVGGFAMSVESPREGRVFALEPSAKNFEALVKNLDLMDMGRTVTPVRIGLGDTNSLFDMSISGSGQDNSILGVDSPEDDLSESQVVELRTLANFISEHEIDEEECFLKVEAEGYEIEVITGLGVFRPQVISLDVSPERYGESPLPQIEKMLSELGYKCILPLHNGDFPVSLMAYYIR